MIICQRKQTSPNKNSIISYDRNLNLKDVVEAFKRDNDFFAKNFVWRKDHIFYSAEDFFSYECPIESLPDLCNIYILFLSSEDEVNRVLDNPAIDFDSFTNRSLWFLVFIPDHITFSRKDFRFYRVYKKRAKKLKGLQMYMNSGFSDLHPSLQIELLKESNLTRRDLKELQFSGVINKTTAKKLSRIKITLRDLNPKNIWNSIKAKFALWF